MKKILPGIYKGRVKNKNFNQESTVLNKIEKEVSNVLPEDENRSVNRQIKDIFSSANYVYKADVSIIMNDGTNLKKTIIGRTNNSLITIDDELIDVRNINQIDFLS